MTPKLTRWLAIAAVLALATSVPAIANQHSDDGRTEVPVSNPHDPADGVVVSLVTLTDPLPATAPPHPAACDEIRYLKYRLAGASPEPAAADSVLVAQPGSNAGAASLDRLARNTLVQARIAGRSVQFWALDRRGNCLEDNTGLLAAARTGDAKVAFDYYYGGRAVDGRTFAGFAADRDLPLVAELGFRQTVLDENFVLRREIPDPEVRRSKVFLGGHSLGGFITAAYGAWDFDGTEAGRGYNQVAGFFALDSFVSADPFSQRDNPLFAPVSGLIAGGSYDAVVAGLRGGALPRTLRAGNLSLPELSTILGALGVAATAAPGAESRLAQWVPRGGSLDTYAQFVSSKEAWNYLTRTPSWRDYRLTNAAALGAMLDENSEPLAPFQASIGTFDTPHVAQKHYPILGVTTEIPGLGLVSGALLGSRPRIIPTRPATLTGWRSFDAMAGAPVQRGDLGAPITSAASEVTDLADLARALQVGPLNYVETYFPTRMLADAAFMSLGARSGDLAPIRFAEQLKAKPVITLCAAETPYCTFAPGYLNPTKVILPGYSHIDVVSAAGTQHDGRPEQVAAELVRFTVQHSHA